MNVSDLILVGVSALCGITLLGAVRSFGLVDALYAYEFNFSIVRNPSNQLMYLYQTVRSLSITPNS